MAARTVEFRFLGRPVTVEVDFRGIFGGSTADGVRIDVLKSLVQKGIRRGDLVRALGAFVRLLAFDADTQTSPGGRAITTNAINRLPVIAAEDVGLGNACALPRVLQAICDLRRACEEAREAGRSYDAGAPLAEVIALLGRSPKSRLASHARAAFVVRLDHESTRSRVPFLEEALALVQSSASPAMLSGLDVSGWERADAEDLARFSWVLRHGRELPGARLTRFLGVRYLYGLHESANRYPVLRGWPTARKARSSPVFPAWQMIRAQVAGTERANIVDTCYRWYLQESEPHVYLLLAYFVAVEDELEAVQVEAGLAEEVLAGALAPLEVPDWAVDMHTAPGRQAGKSAADFAQEGSLVRPEVLTYPELKEIYIERKMKGSAPSTLVTSSAPEAGPAEVKSNGEARPAASTGALPGCLTKELRAELEADDTPHGQLLTSRSKQPTYLPVRGALAGWVWKGPYSAGSGKLAGIQFRAACFRLLGTKACLATVVPDETGGRWCCYPNISPVPYPEWRLERRQDRCLGKEVLVVDGPPCAASACSTATWSACAGCCSTTG